MTARSLSRTAIARSLTFKLTAKNNKNRPISHRKTGGQSVFLFCQATQKIDKAAAKVAHLRATFGAFRGIGEGGTASPRGAGAGARPLHTPNMRGALLLCSPLERALRPAPRVTFVSRRKSPKACQGRCPWTPLGGIIIPPAARRAAPPRKGRVPLRVAGFATLRWCEQLAFLSPEAPSGKHPLLSNRGAGITGDECVSCVGFVSSLCQGIWLN